jgi:hypothetical protein
MLPETASSTYCVMAFHSQNSTSSPAQAPGASSRSHMTGSGGQRVTRVVYSDLRAR